MRKLVKSILFGAAAPFLLLFLNALSSMLAYGPLHEETLQALHAVFLLVAFVFVLVTLSSLFIGLPTTWVLQRLGAESKTAYLVIGGSAGFLVALLVFQVEWAFVGVIVGFFGFLSGIATAGSWWRWHRAEAQNDPSAGPSA